MFCTVLTPEMAQLSPTPWRRSLQSEHLPRQRHLCRLSTSVLIHENYTGNKQSTLALLAQDCKWSVTLQQTLSPGDHPHLSFKGTK